MSTKGALVTVLLLAACLACRPDDQRTDTLDMEAATQKREQLPPDLVAQLDSGSQAYREQDMERALRHYTRATEIDQDVGAAWFGVYMAEKAMGNMEAAQEAIDRAQRIVPGATLIHPGRGDTIP